MAQSKEPTKATMAPAAVNPQGQNPPAAAGAAEEDRGSWLNRSLRSVSADDLRTLRNRIDAELRSRPGERPEEPSFGVSEGTRQELEQRANLPEEQRGVVASPFTGAPLDEHGKPIKETDKPGSSSAE